MLMTLKWETKHAPSKQQPQTHTKPYKSPISPINTIIPCLHSSYKSPQKSTAIKTLNIIHIPYPSIN